MKCGRRPSIPDGRARSPPTRGQGRRHVPRRARPYTVRYTDGPPSATAIRFKGRFLADGAVGTLRARMQIRKRASATTPATAEPRHGQRGREVVAFGTRCSKRVRRWRPGSASRPAVPHCRPLLRRASSRRRACRPRSTTSCAVGGRVHRALPGDQRGVRGASAPTIRASATRSSPTTRSCSSPAPTPRRSARASARACRPARSGRPPRAATTTGRGRGATRSTPSAATAPRPRSAGRCRSARTRPAPRRAAPSSSPATSGSGSPTTREDGWGVVRGGCYLDTQHGLHVARELPADPARATATTGFRIVFDERRDGWTGSS